MSRSLTAVARRRHTRVAAVALLVALLVPLLMSIFPAAARANPSQDAENYSLYKLASNAASYFGNQNAPGRDGGGGAEKLHENWRPIVGDPGDAGSMIGYADPEFSLSLAWLQASLSGSSQTLSYDTFKSVDGKGQAIPTYDGLLDYAYFGAANQALGFDSMSSGIGGQIVSTIGGSIVWAGYVAAIAVGMVFFVIIQILKLINPFLWFHAGISAVSPTYAAWADGMTQGQRPPGALAGLSQFIASWYGTLADIAWQALVPLFIGFLAIGLVLFKKMDRGSAIKKLIVRIVFIGVGVPLVGSMYTSVLDKFDDSVLGQHAGPTRVVLSTYVDFEAWMMDDRLAIPAEATVSWDNGQAGSDAQMAVRTSALAINVQSHGGIFADVNVGAKATDAESAWRVGSPDLMTPETDATAFGTTLAMLNRYILGAEAHASDFESGVKSSIGQVPDDEVSSDDRAGWFVGDRGYGDVDQFGEQGTPTPADHPLFATQAGSGLRVDRPRAPAVTYTTDGAAGCGYKVTDGTGKPAACNMSPLAAYNYLNTSFGPRELTAYSSERATSGFTRESHMSVSQVGSGPAAFMYWANAVVLLYSIAFLGIWYAIGMLIGSVKRTFGIVAAIPFATLGALAAISKVIAYSMALILEVLVTLFIYQFVSEFLIAVPDIIAGPMSTLVGGQDNLLSRPILGPIAVIVMTGVSSLLIVGVTIALIWVRKEVLQAMDEAVTKLVDKFLDTNTTPNPEKGSLMPALAAGAGTGGGMIAGQKLGAAMSARSPGTNPDGSKPWGPTNAGGTNGTPALTAGRGRLALEGNGGRGGGDGGSPNSGADGGGPTPVGGSGDEVRALPAGEAAQGPGGPAGHGQGSEPDTGTELQLTSGGVGSSRSDKALAQDLSAQGGLSNLGYSTGGRRGAGSAGGTAGNVVIPGEVVGDVVDAPSTSSTAAKRKPQDGAGSASSAASSAANGVRFSVANDGSVTQGRRLNASGRPQQAQPEVSASGRQRASRTLPRRDGSQRQPAQGAPAPRPAPAQRGTGQQASPPVAQTIAGQQVPAPVRPTQRPVIAPTTSGPGSAEAGATARRRPTN